MEYPKIHSLWKREGWYFDEKDKKGPQKSNRQSFIIGDYAQPEFANIMKWRVEEKIDGTNVRIFYKNGKVRFGGRTDDAQIPTNLLIYLQDNFGEWNFSEIFPCKENEPYPHVVLFGEGYGAKIQKKGEKYSPTPSFILFDIFISGWWLVRKDIEVIANHFKIPVVPSFGLMTEAEIISFVKSKPNSELNSTYGCMEGVVCKTEPMMMFRNRPVISENPLQHADYHIPIVWKLKCKEFM